MFQSLIGPPTRQIVALWTIFFWSALETKVYQDRREPFNDLNELQECIESVWNDAVDLEVLKKAILQFRPRLEAVVKNKGNGIKQFFG